jgi:hypothetical protein
MTGKHPELLSPPQSFETATNTTRQVLYRLGDGLRKLYQPFIREDVTDQLRATIERLEAKSRERMHV